MVANTGKLAGKTLFITGASRGIGKAIAIKAARDGANITIAAKTTKPHPKLAGTIYTAAKEVEEAGGQCLPCPVDIRNEEQVCEAIEKTVKRFGGIDILVNNASAISLTGTQDTPMKKYDLMHSVNVRGTYLCSKLCLPYLSKSSNPHILNISPPLNMHAKWFAPHTAYTMAKYGMSMCVLGMAEEFKLHGVAVNALWPQSIISTAATDNLPMGSSSSRKPDIMSDAAYAVLTRDSSLFTGNFAIDEVVLRDEGLSDADIEQYSCEPGNDLILDVFLDDWITTSSTYNVTKSDEFSLSDFNGGSRNHEVSNVFDSLHNTFHSSSLDGAVNFSVKGTGDWFLELNSGRCLTGVGTKADALSTVILTTPMCLKIFSSQRSFQAAVNSGLVTIAGRSEPTIAIIEQLCGGFPKSKL